jgi:hypothetical protein
MLGDGKSVPKYVEAICASYRHMMANNNEYAERELIKLIEIKEKDPNFTFQEGTGYYREFDNSIFVSNACINTLNHETYIKIFQWPHSGSAFLLVPVGLDFMLRL